MLNRISRSNKFSLIFTPFLFLTQPTLAAWYDINMTKGVTTVSNEVFDLHMLIFWVCVVIGIVVFGVMFYSMFAHSKKRNPNSATFHENTKLEIVWTIVPFLILVLMFH